jgi:hypothetical protein
MSESEPTGAGASRLGELRTSARGWHGVQLAVLGFIGLCGVLKQRASADPLAVQVLAGVLALAALALACLATYLVGRAAWPLYGAERRGPPADDPDDLASTSRRLRRGLILTFVAVALLALSAASGWWPLEQGSAGGTGFVELQAGDSSWCGRLAEAQAGSVSVVTAEQRITIPVESLTAIRPASSCG